MPADFPQTPVNQVKRKPERGHYDAATIFPIIDEALYCHVAFVQAGRANVIPILHARQDERILLHGSHSSRLLRHVAEGHEVCLAFTLVDALVLARSAFNHSVNYRSAVVYGTGQVIQDETERWRALDLITERLAPGRLSELRPMTLVEVKQTAVMAVSIDSASAKIRTGPPGDDEADVDFPVWAGLLPVRIAYGPAEPAPNLKEGQPAPDYIRHYRR